MRRAVLLLVVVAGALAGCSASPPVGAPCAAGADPAALACRIGWAQGVVDDPAAPPDRLAEAGRTAEAGFRLLSEHPEWDAAVLGELGPKAREQARLAADAGRQLLSLAGPPATSLPAWHVVEPPPLPVLRGWYAEAQRRFGVDWTVLAAINLVETRLGRVVGASSAGALGPMQFMPATWAAYGLGGDVWNQRDAILGAAHYLASNGGADPARVDHAVERYNHDVRYVRAVRDYAAMLAADPDALRGVCAWPVTWRTTTGTVVLPTGYAATTRTPLPPPIDKTPGQPP